MTQLHRSWAQTKGPFILSRRCLHIHVHCGSIHKSEEIESDISWKKGKENVAHITQQGNQNSQWKTVSILFYMWIVDSTVHLHV